MAKEQSEKKQVHITLSTEARKELEELQKKLDVSSISDVIRSSIALTKFIAMEKANGNEIIIRNIKDKKEKIIATLR
ncbi:hypothetical protein HYU07_04230 [Candidatus Woesearchaeota archaeon]|nr:hypothetical protein [Candidatus Woesearchaeota archaeon]